MDINKKNRELISAFGDNALTDPGDQELALAALDTPEGRQAWDRYHHIGDILRAATAPPALTDGFAERLAARLAAEPLPGKRSTTAGEVVATPLHAK